jgi:hypothetical protein
LHPGKLLATVVEEVLTLTVGLDLLDAVAVPIIAPNAPLMVTDAIAQPSVDRATVVRERAAFTQRVETRIFPAPIHPFNPVFLLSLISRSSSGQAVASRVNVPALDPAVKAVRVF